MSLLTPYQHVNIVEAQRRAGYKNAAEFLGELAIKNDLLNFLPFLPASHGIYHQWLEAAKLGKGSWGKANSGIAKIASTSDLQTEGIFTYEADSLVDDRILKTAPNKIAVRDSEDAANAEGFMQDWFTKLFYADGSDPDGFKGLAARRSTVDSDVVFSCGGSGSDLTSLWLFELGENGFNMRYAVGAQPGFSNEDKGLQYVAAPDGTGNYWAWVRHFEILAGLQIKKKHSVQRLANIETAGVSNLFDPDIFIKMKNKLPEMGRGAMGFGNRTLHAEVETAAYNKTNAAYSLVDIEGFGPVTRVVGVPIMIAEVITDTETAVS